MSGGGPSPVKIETRPLTAGPALTDIIKEMPSLRDKYIPNAIKDWRRYNVTDPTAVTDGKFLTLDKYIAPKGAINNQKGEAGFDRLAVVLNQDINIIVVFPSVRGNLETLAKCLKFATDRDYESKGNVVLIFSPGFFGTDTPTNANLLANFLKFKTAAVAQVYLLSESTAANKAAGNAIQAPDDPRVGVPILNMLEPTYIVYPFARNIDEKVVGGILFSGAAADEVDLPASNITSIPGLAEYIRRRGRETIAFSPNLKVNDDLGKVTPYKIYRFMGPNAQTINTTDALRLTLKSGGNEDERESYMENRDKFIPADNDELMLDGIVTAQIDVKGKLFSIRKPDRAEAVIENWEQLKFTKDEAELLYTLNLRPSFLPRIFGPNWKDDLADFLESLVVSNCFIDQDLLTSGECDVASVFVNKVAAFFLQHEAGIERDREDEEEAAARQAEDLAHDAFDTRTTAAEAARAAAAKQKAELERIKSLAVAMGIDPKISADAIAKDPFDDKVIKDTGNEPDTIRNELRKDDSGKWLTEVFAARRATSNLKVAELVIDAVDEKDADAKVDIAFKNLESGYPGWFFSRGQISDDK